MKPCFCNRLQVPTRFFVLYLEDIIVFDGLSVDELEQSFHAVIDEYLADCESLQIFRQNSR